MRNTVAASPTTASPAAKIARQRKVAAFTPASALGCTPSSSPPATVDASPARRPFECRNATHHHTVAKIIEALATARPAYRLALQYCMNGVALNFSTNTCDAKLDGVGIQSEGLSRPPGQSDGRVSPLRGCGGQSARRRDADAIGAAPSG